MREMTTNRNLFVFIAVVLGIFTATILNITPVWWLLVGLFSICSGIILFIFNRRIIGWTILLFFIGFSGFLFSQARYNYLNVVKWNQTFANKVVTIEGIQVERFEETRHGITFVIKADPKQKHSPSGKLTVFWREKIPTEWYGHRLRITGKFKVNPLEYNYFPGFLEKRKYTGFISVIEKPVLIKGYGLPMPFIWANNVRESMINQ